jgi:hypothetical protein
VIVILLAMACGTELWSQKVLTDPGAARALAPAPAGATIAQLGALPRTSRRRAYAVTGRVAERKNETDSDLHVVITDGVHSMIVELPHPQCAHGSLALRAISRARLQAAALRVGQTVRVVGMLFFDRPHGQSGMAPNAVELHPVFSVRRLR